MDVKDLRVLLLPSSRHSLESLSSLTFVVDDLSFVVELGTLLQEIMILHLCFVYLI